MLYFPPARSFESVQGLGSIAESGPMTPQSIVGWKIPKQVAPRRKGPQEMVD